MRADWYLHAFPPEVDDSWRRDAACIGQSDLFFIEQGTRAKEAKAICGTCPVIEECRDYALRTVPVHGIWAGRTYREMRADRRKRRAVA